MKIVVLTSSRADYGIYRPLLRELGRDSFFHTSIVAFGTHLSEAFGSTIREIEQDGFSVAYRVDTMPRGDTPQEIAGAMGRTISQFAPVWKELSREADLVMTLGDRYEMLAAALATVPFQLTLAHIHGGETTLGAIDNVFRHSLTHIARYHFASTQGHAERVAQLKGDDLGVYNTGALSLDNIKSVRLLDAREMQERFSIPIQNPVLVTFHPETVQFERNEFYVRELIAALSKIDDQIVITMPNADTANAAIRTALASFAHARPNTYIVESFGTQGYFSALKFCKYMMGNSSSGIIEAASFGKYAIDLGDRQKGRERGTNVLHCKIDTSEILEAVSAIEQAPPLDMRNIYGDGNAAVKIARILRNAPRSVS